MFTPDQIHMLASVTVIFAAINSLGAFIIKLMVDNAIKSNNDVLLTRINGSYVKKELCTAFHEANAERITRLEDSL